LEYTKSGKGQIFRNITDLHKKNVSYWRSGAASSHAGLLSLTVTNDIRAESRHSSHVSQNCVDTAWL